MDHDTSGVPGTMGVIVTKSGAEIDTRAPFKSVKEAVILFGERVLVGEVYANKLKEIQNGERENVYPSKLGTVTAELEETKLNLEKAREEGKVMANCLNTLREELEQTKRELQQMKIREQFEKQRIESDEDLKFVENTTKFEIFVQNNMDEDDEEEAMELEKKRIVKFASPPSLAQVMRPVEVVENEAGLERHLSMKKKKKKPLIPLFGGIFGKKKGTQELPLPKVRAA